MKKEPQNVNEKETEKTNNEKKDEMKKGFFKKVWYSIDKIDKYSELSAEGLKSAPSNTNVNNSFNIWYGNNI